MKNIDMFATPIRSGTVNKDADWHQYSNGTINIMGQKYIGYPIKEAIRLYRKKVKEDKLKRNMIY